MDDSSVDDSSVDDSSNLTISSSWSEPYDEFNRRELVQYFEFLKFLENSGKLLLLILIFVLFALTVNFLLTKEFEQVIFTDGSELICIYDNDTNRVIRSFEMGK